jgi:hypothetical protein
MSRRRVVTKARHVVAERLGVNELHGSQYRSLVQLMGLLLSYEVGARRRGCCTYLLYHTPSRTDGW